jgi:hypothetical protein
MATTHARHKHSSWYANYINHAIRLIALLVLSAIAVEIYRYLLSDIISGRSHFIAYLVLWLFSAYLVLPRINRVLARIYLPSYFIGRTRTGDGILGDPINLALYGTKHELITAMKLAGWQQAEKIGLSTSIKMAYSAVGRRNYPNAPVSTLFVFNRRQNFAFEKDLDGNPRKRHHVRFWETPSQWWLPGGYRVDWLGAATFDEHVGLSLFTGQITHKIDADVDQERDFVIETLTKATAATSIRLVEHFTTSYHSRNGGGDVIHTDGALPFIDLRKGPAADST